MTTAVRELSATAQELLQGFRKAAREAVNEAHAAGLSTSHGDDKGIYNLFPDGHREYVKLYSEDA